MPVVLGDQWYAASPVVQILAWVGIVQALQSLNIDILMARDRTRTIFRFSIVVCTAHLIAFSVGLQWGVVGVAVAYAISTTLVEPFQTVLAARALGVSPMVFVRSVGRGLPGRARHVRRRARASATRSSTPESTRLARLVVCIGAGGVVYVGALRLARARAGRGGARAPAPPRRSAPPSAPAPPIAPAAAIAES